MAHPRLVGKNILPLLFAFLLAAQPAFADERKEYPGGKIDVDGQSSAVRLYVALVRLEAKSKGFAEKDSKVWMGDTKKPLFDVFGFARSKEREAFYGDLKKSVELVIGSPGGPATETQKLMGHRPALDKSARNLLVALGETRGDFDGSEAKKDIQRMISILKTEMDTGLALGKADAKLVIEKAALEANFPYQRDGKETSANSTDLFRVNLLDLLTTPRAKPIHTTDVAAPKPPAPLKDDSGSTGPSLITDTTTNGLQNLEDVSVLAGT